MNEEVQYARTPAQQFLSGRGNHAAPLPPRTGEPVHGPPCFLHNLTYSGILRVGIALHAQHALYSHQSSLDGLEIGRQFPSQAILVDLILSRWKAKIERS